LFGISKTETYLIKYGEGKVVNYIFYPKKDKVAAEKFAKKNKGSFIKEFSHAKRNTN